MYIHRELEKEIQPFLKRREALAIVGPRQAGKTTFLTHLVKYFESKRKRVRFFTFENRTDVELFEKDIHDFKQLIEPYDCVIIDEFQYAKEGGQNLKYLYDTTNIKFIISGSSSLELTFQTGRYMVGRLLTFNLGPFSFREYLSYVEPELFQALTKKISHTKLSSFKIEQGFGDVLHERLTHALEIYCIYGGYPAVVLARTMAEKQKLLEGIINTYLLKEIKGLLHLASERGLLTTTRLLAAQIGNLVSYQELSASSSLSYQEVKRHISILEKTFILRIVRPFFKNKRTEVVKNPKTFFLDLGLRNFLLSDFRPLQTRNDFGAIMENHAYNALSSLHPGREIRFWRTKSKAEVDFVIEKEGRLYPLEVKYSGRPKIGKSLYSFINKFNPDSAFVLTRDIQAKQKIGETTVRFTPLSYL